MVNAVVAERSSPAKLRAGELLPAAAFDRIRRQFVLDGCKWDPQVGDVETIARFPLILSGEEWRDLSNVAEELTLELMSAERELLSRPELQGKLGLHRALRQVLAQAGQKGATVAAARVMRFDFHLTEEGWKLSEVNSDVPGGYAEASLLPVLMAPHYSSTKPAGHPGSTLTKAIAASTGTGEIIALLSAPGFMEDRQVISYLAQLLTSFGSECRFAQPREFCWENGRAFLNVGRSRLPAAAIIRFYQAEWLTAARVAELFVGGRTPVVNPGTAALTESKRFPLIWRSLGIAMPTWERFLPETRDPRDVPWKVDDRWLVKSAMCNTGDTVAIRGLMNDRQWKQVRRAIWWKPGDWIAQRRFHPVPVDSPAGPIYPCVGIYTIDGQTAGIYGRYSTKPVIDFQAVDVAVLIEADAEVS